MHTVFLSIGTNLGNRLHNLQQSIAFIKKDVGAIQKVTGIYETEPWGFYDESFFYNLVVEITTDLNPDALFNGLQSIEQQMGRKKTKKGYESRIIDIDILFFDDFILESEKLTLPHPQLPNRNFVLLPLVEIAPDFVHPKLQKTSLKLLEDCQDKGKIKRIGSWS